MSLRTLLTRPSSAGSSSWTGLGASVGGHAVLLGALALSGLGLHGGSEQSTIPLQLTTDARPAPAELDLRPLAEWTMDDDLLAERPDTDVAPPASLPDALSSEAFAAPERPVAPRPVEAPAFAAVGTIARSQGAASGSAASPAATPANDVSAAPPRTSSPQKPSSTGATQVAARGATRAPALPANLSQPDYPRRARKRGWEGRVVLELTVAASGKVTAARVADSSGRGLLDEAARKHALDWTLEPALVNGQAAPGTLRVPVRFALQ